MNSAPAAPRIPALGLKSMASMSSPGKLENEPYPWAAYTPEVSPRYWGAAPDVPVKPIAMPSLEWLRMMCKPCFEQVCCIARQISEETLVSRDLLRTMCKPCFDQKIMELQQLSMAPCELLRAMCEPFFEEMITAAHHHTLQQHALQQHYNNQCQSMHTWSATGMRPQPVFYPNMMKVPDVDEVSTEAADSSGPWSEDSEPTEAVEKGSMVCRHWKFKGWCRLESKCKFLHPEQKCGISAPIGVSGSRIHAVGSIRSLSLVDAEGAQGAVPAVAANRLRKRKDKNRSSRGKEDQPANA